MKDKVKDDKREMMKVIPKRDHVIHHNEDHYVLKAGKEISIPKMYKATLVAEKLV